MLSLGAGEASRDDDAALLALHGRTLRHVLRRIRHGACAEHRFLHVQRQRVRVDDSAEIDCFVEPRIGWSLSTTESRERVTEVQTEIFEPPPFF